MQLKIVILKCIKYVTRNNKTQDKPGTISQFGIILFVAYKHYQLLSAAWR